VPARVLVALLSLVGLMTAASASAAAGPISVPYVDGAGIHDGEQLVVMPFVGALQDLVELGPGTFAVLTVNGKARRLGIIPADDYAVSFSDAVSVVGSADDGRFAYVRTISGGRERLVVRRTNEYYDKVATVGLPASGRTEVIGFRHGLVWLSEKGWQDGVRRDRTRTYDVARGRFTLFSSSRAAESMSTRAGQVALIRQRNGCVGYDVVSVPRKGNRSWRLCDDWRDSNQLVWSPDGRLLLHPVHDDSAAQYTRIEVRNARTGRVLATVPVGGRLLRVAWETSAHFLITADDAEPHGADPAAAWVDRCDRAGTCERVTALDPGDAAGWIAARPRG
jgi:hypothetical protein